jgi:hypothetical protein
MIICKYCKVPMIINRVSEDDYECYCPECGYDVS